jgi:UDP-N-acetylmuramate: L-alanyl-gamma-D-glutamyl-meso-diaminopimelate ligase
LSFKNKKQADFQLAMIGRHNVENAAAVAALCFRLGLTADEINFGFRSFKGVKRRQEIVGEKNGIIIIDDFAHHPTAINLTIDAVKEAYRGQRVWAVFEPRSATSRRKVFEDSFPKSFLKADRVILAGLFAPEKIKDEERLDVLAVIASIQKMGGVADHIPQVDDIVKCITTNAKPEDVILVMSSGGFDNIHQKLLERL